MAAVAALSAGAAAQDVVRDSAQAAPAAVGQSDSTARSKALGDEPRQPRAKRESNVLGAPVYYDANGNVVGGKRQSTTYHRPRHHYLNNLNDIYCSYFLEGEMLVGHSDIAGGFNAALLPKRVGGYMSLMGSASNLYVSAGPALRLTGYSSPIDLQLYGGLMLADDDLGGEVGLRFASPRNRYEFCFFSTSLGYARVNGSDFFTVGLSVGVVSIATLLYW